ncbi:MAG TPA: S41 family peptidase [Syntrophales bacterium]|nr:S41 family peptidase [Syntrophales bacterium]HOL58350.1 S41 family peptidase [Syntrophales bacterium]HPO34519.1 S41 family peptidase [Syntrophales bacterium]
MKIFPYRARIAILLLAIAVLLVGFVSDSRVSASVDRSIYTNLKVFTEILSIIEKNYVEPVKAEKLIEGAINGMVKSLDPHSAYMTPDMYKDLEIETKGQFGGVGMEIMIHRDVLTVVAPIEDTPAYHAGIKAGDQIITIDGKPTKEMTLMEAVKKLRGPQGTKVTLQILREGSSKLRDVEITRAIINVRSVKYKMLDPQIAYIRLSSFQEKTADELRRSLQEINKTTTQLKGLVLDLRNNPGGLLPQAVEVADLFLKSGVIVSTHGRTKAMDTTISARHQGNEPECPIVCLVNEGSASASEIVAGALQDNGRALILGTQTFGKGSVQTVIPLEGGAALKLTTARYYTPSGRSIQAEGIKPDIEVKYLAGGEEGERYAIREKDLEGHLKSPNEMKGEPEEGRPPAPAVPREEEKKKDFPLKRPFGDMTKDNQLKSAYDILKSWEIMERKAKSSSK